MTYNLQRGQLVKSNAGRDKGRYFLVYDWDYEYVYVVDGVLRKVQKPKKKNLCHLSFIKQYSELIQSRFQSGVPITNADIRKALNNFE
ncbi:hypothetical protein SAMN00017405_1080 [Desulfonispora thiosulfatigenes DSM 11270]|uniref:Ribosomal protein L14E/L6E/L27E n=1 Tax=Desulfonispora thiosulfatigenes DSM 11270 TaxID=656914 RepID=A0A1W1URQ4_DESTI|nr:KOW domain-containing RNA-binding protein [Desulfonispora thiosulfatigenes]SMB83750.1 hypothetical protein SAMN00017405_1080 [Desulfonispora thiosulfatigenes DSM 11270]